MFKKRYLWLAAVALPLAGTPFTAAAQSAPAETEQAIPSPSEESLRLARDILDLGMPEENREAMFMATMDQLMLQIREAQKRANPSYDPDIEAIIDRTLLKLRNDAEEILAAQLPNLMDGMVLAYANVFTTQELRDIREFVATPSGQRFFELSSAIIAEPNFAAANQRYMEDVMALLPELRSSLEEELLEYLQSQNESIDES